jgi:hypothetical protein
LDDAFAIADRPTLKAVEPRRLLDVLSALCDEVGSRAGGEDPHADDAEPAGEWPPGAMLSEEDEQLVAGLRGGLATLAGALRVRLVQAPAAVRGALDGAELLARSEILSGRRERLPQLLPSFAFLVVLPLVGKSEALRISRRADALLERSGRSD